MTTMPTFEQLVNLVQPLLTADDIGVAIGIQLEEENQFFVEGNVVAVDGSPLELDADTLWAIGSVSKTFDATLYAWALQSGLSPTATLGEFPYPGANPLGSNYAGIPLQSLATYSSGLPRDNNDPHWPNGQKAPYTFAEMYDYLSTNPFPLNTPGYAYSNLGFALLGASLPIAVGQSELDWATLLGQQITGPLGMSGTTLDEVDPSQLPQSFVGATARGGVSVQYPAYDPAGGLVFSAADFMTWLQVNMGPIGSPLSSLLPLTQTVSSPYSANGNEICLGWFYSRDANMLVKDGATLGFNSLVHIVATDDPGMDQSPAGVFLFVNQQTSLLPSIMASIFDIINDTSGTPAIAAPVLDAQ